MVKLVALGSNSERGKSTSLDIPPLEGVSGCLVGIEGNFERSAVLCAYEREMNSRPKPSYNIPKVAVTLSTRAVFPSLEPVTRAAGLVSSVRAGGSSAALFVVGERGPGTAGSRESALAAAGGDVTGDVSVSMAVRGDVSGEVSISMAAGGVTSDVSVCMAVRGRGRGGEGEAEELRRRLGILYVSVEEMLDNLLSGLLCSERACGSWSNVAEVRFLVS